MDSLPDTSIDPRVRVKSLKGLIKQNRISMPVYPTRKQPPAKKAACIHPSLRDDADSKQVEPGRHVTGTDCSTGAGELGFTTML